MPKPLIDLTLNNSVNEKEDNDVILASWWSHVSAKGKLEEILWHSYIDCIQLVDLAKTYAIGTINKKTKAFHVSTYSPIIFDVG